MENQGRNQLSFSGGGAKWCKHVAVHNKYRRFWKFRGAIARLPPSGCGPVENHLSFGTCGTDKNVKILLEKSHRLLVSFRISILLEQKVLQRLNDHLWHHTIKSTKIQVVGLEWTTDLHYKIPLVALILSLSKCSAPSRVLIFSWFGQWLTWKKQTQNVGCLISCACLYCGQRIYSGRSGS